MNAMDVLDPRALRYFQTVARIGSIRGAAEHLGLAASIVSRQVVDIEKSLGLTLFERTGRGVVLAEAGRVLLEHAKRLAEDQDLLGERLDRLRSVQKGRVRVLCGEGFVADLVEHGLRDFNARHPTIRYAVEFGSTEAVLDGVAGGDADIGIVFNPAIDVRIRPLAVSRQPLCVVTPPAHPLLAVPGLTLARCLGEPLALLSKGHGVTQLVGWIAAEAGIVPSPVLETRSIDILRRFVAAGMGVTFLPRFAVTTEEARGVVAVAELADPLVRDVSSQLFVRAGRRLPASVDGLARHLASRMVAFRT